MRLTVQDLDDQTKFRPMLTISYKDLVQFILEYLMKKSGLIIFFWSVCLIFGGIALIIRINMQGEYSASEFLTHSILGLILFPLLCVPVHELLHIIPFYISGAREIRVGMDLKQFLFYVTAHRYVTSGTQFIIVAMLPFITISSVILLFEFFLPGIWKWSLSLFLFVHATMCAGDIALLNFYCLNRGKKIFTWDDADKKETYFYEKLE